MQQVDNNSSSDYDEVPYSSSPYCESTPENCRTIARLFKLNPPDFHKAAVLELGCASGGNLIPLAYSYPDATFVGIDLSAGQIETGQKQVEEMNLTNIQLRNLSILDADESLGKFDYIISHGVFSWVDATTQEKLVSLCDDLLTSNGIAYVSYNTLPGWNTLRSIRDMMNYHTKNIADPKTRARQARAILEFVLEGLQGNTSSYADFFRKRPVNWPKFRTVIYCMIISKWRTIRCTSISSSNWRSATTCNTWQTLQFRQCTPVIFRGRRRRNSGN